MNLDKRAPSRVAVDAKFDLLRVKLETTIVRPAVIAVVASTAADGKEVSARGLASSLARAGYSTLLVDTSLSSHNQSKSGSRSWFDEIELLKSTPDPRAGSVTMLTLDALGLQNATSQRDIQSAFSIFRRKYDYVVISTEYSETKSFATSLFIAADAVFVSVMKGRREEADDAQLAAALDTIGSRFLGLLALDSALLKNDSIATNVSTPFDVRRGQTTPIEKERKRRESADSAIS